MKKTRTKRQTKKVKQLGTMQQLKKPLSEEFIQRFLAAVALAGLLFIIYMLAHK